MRDKDILDEICVERLGLMAFSIFLGRIYGPLQARGRYIYIFIFYFWKYIPKHSLYMYLLDNENKIHPYYI